MISYEKTNKVENTPTAKKPKGNGSSGKGPAVKSEQLPLDDSAASET